MVEYKVIALSVGGKGNKIFHSGDIVSDKNFPDGNAEKLVELGFLKLHNTGKSEAKADANEGDSKSQDDANAIPAGEAKTDTVKTFDQISKKELVKDLTDANVAFDEKASKKELYELWLNK